MTPCPELHIPHKEWSGREELENYHAIEAWARTRGCSGCDCYIKHSEATQTISADSNPIGTGTLTPVTLAVVGTSGTPAADAMVMLVVRWAWTTIGSGDPYVSNGVDASARGVFVFPAVGATPIAGDTRLALGGAWCAAIQRDMGSLSIPLNVFPAGQDYRIEVCQSSGDDLDLEIAATEFTVCPCSLVL